MFKKPLWKKQDVWDQEGFHSFLKEFPFETMMKLEMYVEDQKKNGLKTKTVTLEVVQR